MNELTPLYRHDRTPRLAPWLTDVQAAGLAQDLRDIPQLADELVDHLGEFLGHRTIGDQGPKGPSYPISFTVLDLLDERTKGADWADDPIGEADLAQRCGAARHGILVTLESWVRLADGEMWDCDVEHMFPAETPSIATEAGWLGAHLEWIATQQWSTELAEDITRIAGALRTLVGDGRILDDTEVVDTMPGIAGQLKVSTGAIRKLVWRGQLKPALGPDGQPMTTNHGRPLYWVRDARELAEHFRRVA